MYFDYPATTPPHKEVLKAYDAVNRDFWANPHALHRPGLRAESLLEQARLQVLNLLGAEQDYRCVFTSGATESNNMAIFGAARKNQHRGRHIITSAAEHPSVLEVFRVLEREGWACSILPITPAGSVDPEQLAQALRPDTTLVSLMHVNNEIGSITDVEKLGHIIKTQSDAAFHVDAAQSIGKLPFSLKDSPIDYLSFSAHKFFGLKGSGALLLRNRQELPPLLHGGGQEAGLRSGTADTARAVALAKALRLSLEDCATALERAQFFRNTIEHTFSAIPDTFLNGTHENTSPFIINHSVIGMRPETLLQALAEQEIYISTVSACSAHKAAESSVVFALTGNKDRATSSIRISLSALTTEEEIQRLCTTLPPLIESLRFKRKRGNS